MAITTKKKYSGQNKTDVLSGRIRIEEGNNRMVIQEGAVELVNITKDGLALSDGTHLRLLLGVFPDGTIGLVVSKPGVDVTSVFA